MACQTVFKYLLVKLHSRLFVPPCLAFSLVTFVTATGPTPYVLLVCLEHFIHLLWAAHENARSVMNIRRLDREHSLHLRIHSLSTCVLHDHSHGRTLVQNPQFALRTLLVGRIREDTAVQQRAVRIRYHGPDVSC